MDGRFAGGEDSLTRPQYEIKEVYPPTMPEPAPPLPRAHKRGPADYEYKVVPTFTTYFSQVEGELNKLAAQGWEPLFPFSSHTYSAILMRRLK